MPETLHRLQPLMAPRSVAIVGASPREGSFGNNVIRVLLDGGYDGAWYPVNPKYDEIEGKQCYATLGDLPSPVDQVIACVNGQRMEALFDDAIAAGIPAITVFDSCYIENDTNPPLLQRLRDKSRDSGLLVCGGNGMGFYNFDACTHASFQGPMTDQAGGVSLIAHSGSVFVLLANHDLRHRFNMVVSASQEISCSVADYMDYALDQPSTRVIALFIETIRDPEGFVRALARANERKIPVVALKTGRTAESAKLAATHSGAIAGNDAAYEALFNRYGVIRAKNLDDLLAISAVLSQPLPIGEGGFAAVTDSGGLCELLMDLASDLEQPFADLSPKTLSALANRLPHGLAPGNPLDAAGSLTEDFAPVFRDCLSIMLQDPAVALAAFEFEIQDRYQYMPEFLDIAKAAGKEAGKPVIALNSFSGAFNHDIACELADAGVPLINGVETCLNAARGALAYRDFLQRPADPAPDSPAREIIGKWRTRLSEGKEVSEHEALSLLGDFGVPVVNCRVAATLDEVLASAKELGYPVALKTAVEGIEHKSDAGGVSLNLADEEALSEAYNDMSERLGPEAVVQPMIDQGAEIAFGMTADDQFGPIVMLAAGGTLIELMAERSVALAPLGVGEAGRMLDGLKVKKLLEGHRGTAASDRQALLHVLSAFSVMVDSLADVLESVDVNPMICGPAGCVAADALIIPRKLD